MNALCFSNCLTAPSAPRILFPARSSYETNPCPGGLLSRDGSDTAHAREMAHALRAELHLVHVREIAAVPIFPAATIGYPGIGMPEMGMAGGLPVGAPGYLPADPPNDEKRVRLGSSKPR